MIVMPATLPGERRTPDTEPCLDDVIPTPDHRSRHRRHVDADPDRVWEALLTASIDAHPIVRLLTASRDLPRRLAGRGSASAGHRTLLEMAPYPIVAVVPGRRVIMAGAGQPWKWTGTAPPPQLALAEVRAFDSPGWVRIAMDIEITPRPGGAIVSTETRVAATDAAARRAFARYWTVIRLPSGLLRRIMVATIAAQAERATRRD